MPMPFELGESNIVNDVVAAAEILLFLVFFEQNLIKQFKTEKQRHTLGVGHVFDQFPIMHDILSHKRRPTADLRVLAHEFAHLKHVFAIIREIVVEKNYRRIPTAETEERAGCQGIIDRGRKV